MNAFRLPATSASTVLATLLLVAVLVAQWAGMVHRIEHALPGAASQLVQVDDDASHVSHSCVMFDGLCLADSLPTAQAAVLLSRAARALSPATAFASWHALLVSHFLSRAPPAA